MEVKDLYYPIEYKNLYYPPDKWFVETDKPLVFLAGPIQGANNWQLQAIKLLKESDTELCIANPRRAEWKTEDDPYIQVSWETAHLRLASANGGIMFWLAKETNHICERAFAQTTRFEFAEWLTHYKYRKLNNPDRKLNLVLGIDDDFPGRNYIIHRVFEDCPEFVIATTLEETCQLMKEKLRDANDQTR